TEEPIGPARILLGRRDADDEVGGFYGKGRAGEQEVGNGVDKAAGEADVAVVGRPLDVGGREEG
ncbi:hypothetical protein HK101_009142, partial [Irineochytrium annulatum]